MISVKLLKLLMKYIWHPILIEKVKLLHGT